ETDFNGSGESIRTIGPGASPSGHPIPSRVRRHDPSNRKSIMTWLHVALMALLLCAALPASAGDPSAPHIGPPSLEPQAPSAGEPIFVRFDTGPCLGITDGPADTDISLEGSTITFIVDG